MTREAISIWEIGSLREATDNRVNRLDAWGSKCTPVCRGNTSLPGCGRLRSALARVKTPFNDTIQGRPGIEEYAAIERDSVEKRRDYAEIGVREYYIVHHDPDRLRAPRHHGTTTGWDAWTAGMWPRLCRGAVWLYWSPPPPPHRPLPQLSPRLIQPQSP